MATYDNIRELELFLRVSEESSFSAAARSLDVDPSTISKVMQRLENRLGVRLFHRTSRVLRLTQEGERFLAAAQKVMQALQEAEQSLSPAMNEPTGVLRIGCTPAFARFWLAPLMPSFCDAYPKLKVEFVTSPTAQDLFDQHIDLSFHTGPIPDSSLVVRRVATVRWRIYAAPSYLQRHGTPRTPHDLAQHQCLNFLPGTYRSQWPLAIDGEVHSVSPTGPVASDNGDVLCALAVAGMGLARLVEYRVDTEEPAGRLVTLLDDFMDVGEPVYAVYASRRHLSVRVRSLLDHIAQQIEPAR